MASPARSHRRSSDGDDVCPICLCPMDEGFSRPENCQHRFDLDCLTEWSKLRLSCPSCRAGFGAIYTYEIVDRKPKLLKVQKMEQPKEAEPFEEADPLDFTFCEICNGGQHEELLLICDQCDKGFHTYCLNPPLDGVPTTEQWFCPQCEARRNSLPSTSRSTAPSARTMRFIQRTALAERVRRVLQRSRRILDEPEETSESESADDEDEEEEEEGELIDEDVDGESEETSEEEEVPEFFDDDARVLAEIDDDEELALPSVQRRTKKQREAAAAKKKKTTKTKKGKRKTTKRTTKGKKRRSKGKRRVKKRRTRAPADTKKGPLDAFVTRRGGTHDPVARLSLLGAGLEPVADDDPYDGESSSLITENSRRFDRPLLRRKDTKNEHPITAAKDKIVDEEKPPADSCDLLGSIIPEQVKTLAPGRLFAIGGGRFNTTDDFEKYKERKTNLLSSELKKKLGIPVDKNDADEAKAEVGKSDKMKEKNPSSKSEERRKITAISSHETSSGMPHRAGDTTGRESISRDMRRRDEQRMTEDKHSSSSNRDGESYRRDRDERYRDYGGSGDRRSGRDTYPERRSEERSWRGGTGNEDRAGSRPWEQSEDRRSREQPRGAVRQFGTTVRSELDPPGKVHNLGSGGRNAYEQFRGVGVDRHSHPDRAADKHSVRESRASCERSYHERSKDDRRSTSSSSVPKPQDRDALRVQDRRDTPEPQLRRDSPKVQERRVAPIQDRRDAPLQDRRNSPRVEERKSAHKPQDRRDAPYQDRRDSPYQDKRDPSKVQERRVAPMQDRRDALLQDRRDFPRVEERKSAHKPQDRRDAPYQDRRDSPYQDKRDPPKVQERRDAYKGQDRRDAPLKDRRDSPRVEDRKSAHKPSERRDAPYQDKRDSTKAHQRRDAPETQDRKDAYKPEDRRDTPKLQERKDAHRADDRRSHEGPREVSVQTSPDKVRRRERRERMDSRSRSPRRPEQLIDEIRKNTRDHAHSSFGTLDRRQDRDEFASSERPALVPAKVSKIEESEQEDKGSAKRPVVKNTGEGSLEKAETVWMPTLPSTSALPVTNIASETPATSSSARHDEEKNSNERVKIIEGFAKEAIKQYKRDITVEEYKNVMRAVVRECYKKRVLDGVKIKEKVDESVRAVKNGEQLDVGHHSSKRPETSGSSSAVPVKRQKISV